MGKKDITKVEKLVPDTSVIIEGIVSKKIEAGDLIVQQIMIHEAVVSELEHQSNINKSIGFLGLEEVERIKILSEEKGFDVVFAGTRPSGDEIRHARIGEIDALIRQFALDEGATLFTADKVQAIVGRAKGMNVILVEIERLVTKLKLEGYFDSKTMSVHLREKSIAVAKKGYPGKWDFVEISKKELTREAIKEISREIIEEAKPNGLICSIGLCCMKLKCF